MKPKNRRDIENFVENQKAQLGLSDTEANDLLQATLVEGEMEKDEFLIDREAMDADLFEVNQVRQAASAAPPIGKVRPRPAPQSSKRKKKEMADPYLPQSQTIKARPAKVSKIRSVLYEHALPNEYIVEIGKAGAKPALGGKFFKPGKRYLKFPAAVQTVYFTSDNANKNYQGLKIDGYACWRVDPERPEVAAQALDFSDQDNPMGNTNRILRTICTEAIRHIIANTTIEDALTKKDEIGRDLKSQLERIERTWGVIFDQVGIERVTILSPSVFDDLQQKTRDALRLTAAESRMQTDQEIEKRESAYTEELERLRRQTEKETRILRATTEREIHKVELDEKAKREAEERKDAEDRRKAEAEAEERSAEHQAEQARRQASRDVEIKAHQESETRRLERVKSEADAAALLQNSETEAKVAEARAKHDLAKAKAEHDRDLAQQELEAERRLQEELLNRKLEAERLRAELETKAAYLEAELKERREKATVDHESKQMVIDRLRQEEEIRNHISHNRMQAELMARLPDVAAAMKVDRYTVLDGTGSSPLTHVVSQVLEILENLLEKNKENAGTD